MDSSEIGLTSTLKISKIAGCSKSTVIKYLHNNKFKAYKPRKVQHLMENDYFVRVSFAEKFKKEVVDAGVVLWTDEAYFALSGEVRSLRGSVWSDEPIFVKIESPLHPQKVLVWCGFYIKFYH